MEKKQLFIHLGNSSSKRLSLNYSCSTLNHPIELSNQKNPISNLIKEYEDIINIINDNKNGHIAKFLYFNKKTIHKLLYEKNEVISLDYKEENNNIEFYFYFTLLIKENPNILNYYYDERYIIELNEENKNNDNGAINQIIKAKFVVELVNEFQLDNDIDEVKEKVFNEIIKLNIGIIKNNLDFLKSLNIELNLPQIISYPIDKLYMEIIFGLINEKKFEDFNYVKNIIIKQLNLDQIDITENMYNNLEQFLEKDIRKDYEIENEEDLRKDLKINFTYILINYILKNDYYINNLKFLSSIKQNLKNILKNNKEALKNIEKNKYKKVKNILEILYLKPKKRIKNRLNIYYDEYNNNKKPIEEYNIKINNGELNIVEFIHQIFSIQEYKEEYISRIDSSEVKEKDLNSIIDLLNMDGKSEYIEKLKNVLKSKKLKEFVKRPEAQFDKTILNELFNIINLEDEEKIKIIENQYEEKEIPVSEKAINKLEEWFDKEVKKV